MARRSVAAAIATAVLSSVFILFAPAAHAAGTSTITGRITNGGVPLAGIGVIASPSGAIANAGSA